MVGGYKHVYILPPPTGNQFQKKKKIAQKFSEPKKNKKKRAKINKWKKRVHVYDILIYQ